MVVMSKYGMRFLNMVIKIGFDHSECSSVPLAYGTSHILQRLDRCALYLHWRNGWCEYMHAWKNGGDKFLGCICKLGRCSTALWRGGMLWNVWNTCPFPECSGKACACICKLSNLIFITLFSNLIPY